MQGTVPQHMHFVDRGSAGMHKIFVDNAIQEVLKTSAIRPWIEQSPSLSLVVQV